MKKIFILLYVLVIQNSTVFAAVKCEALFFDKTIQNTDQQNVKNIKLHDILDLELLKKNKLQLSSKNYLYDISGSTPVRLGHLVVMHPKYLYQWAPLSEQKLQIKNKGILQSEMDYILEAGPQAYGKGFYVSMDPHDSHTYGNGLTVFKTDGPMISIEYEGRSIQNLDTDSMKRIANSGVDAIKATNTWLSVITTKHLQTIESKDVITDKFWNDPKNIVMLSDIEKKMKTSSLWKNIPEDNFYKKFIAKSEPFPVILNKDNLETFLNLLGGPHKNTAIALYVKKTIEKKIMEIDYQTASLSEISNSFKYLEKFPIKFRKSNRNDFVSDILEFIDLHSIQKLIQKQPLKESTTLEEAIDFGKKMLEQRAQVNLDKINSADSFLNEIKNMAVPQINFREYDVIMTPDTNIESEKMILEQREHYNIETNKLLTLEILRKKIDKNFQYTTEAYVYYMTLNKLIQLAPMLPLDINLKNHINANKESILKDPSSKVYQETYKLLLRKTLDLYFTPEGQNAILKATYNYFSFDTSNDIKAILLYRSFMALHPFADGNGRAGRIYYEYITAQLNKGISKKLILPNYDLDLFSNPGEVLIMSNIGQHIKYKLSNAKNTDEFIEIVKKANAAYEATYPHYTKQNKNPFKD